MASYQAYQPHAQNKGTLLPGQLLTVNKYAVQVERYLAQGGFAHVYLVTTATPVYNTTRHVLKRIAVANETMLAEVKKEVDIMRILKGHPNIVHLIDAAWHRMPNGLYEVFILMEFCPGGGLIDMMNRRLRERLTEAEILQIFVDVCEGVAAMHNLRPPLLHRDLKVENILQSTSTSYKLCDFGSATSVAPRPPATTQEIRALEADLNRHTTLQYRAPEMVDPYLRRPVDEKSDVWALGVLLYKLCYYTTPFEEHGTLAILNVQYRIPPYPVYSAQINTLIASILREHSAQRPSVFELLSTVHAMRGSKSPFHYTIPPAIPPRNAPPAIQPKPKAQKQLRQQQAGDSSATTSPSKKGANAGVQAREKVLEAISPMRRGRPSSSKEPPSRPRSRPSSPQKASESSQPISQNADGGDRPTWLDGGFSADDEKAWQNVIGMKADASGSTKQGQGTNDAWGLKGINVTSKDVVQAVQTFDDNFRTKIWDSFSPSTASGAIGNLSKSTTTKYRPPAFTGSETARSPTTAIPKLPTKDVFGDLGLVNRSEPPAPTLGEARRLRTGLATMSTTIQGPNPDNNARQNKSGGLSNLPSPSPRPTYLSPSPSQPQSSSKSHSPSPSLFNTAWKPFNQSTPPGRDSLLPDGLPVESRFPSLEELDASFARKLASDISGDPKVNLPDPLLQPPTSRSKFLSSGKASPSHLNTQPPSSFDRDRNGGQSTQPTGLSARGTGMAKAIAEPMHDVTKERSSRPPLRRKHRSTLSFTTPTARTNAGDADNLFSTIGSKLEVPVLGVSSFHSSPRLEQKDWLTGDDNDFSSHSPVMGDSKLTLSSTPVVRSSPSPGVPSVERSPHRTLQEVVLPQHGQSTTLQTLSSNTEPTTTFTAQRPSRIIPSVSKPIAPKQSNELPRQRSPEKSLNKGSDSRILGVTAVKTVAQREGSDDLKVLRSPTRMKTKDKGSSSDEGPEDINGYMPSAAKAQGGRNREQGKKSHKGRQSSVHDLVDLWGGAADTSSSNSGPSFNLDGTTKKWSADTAPSSASILSSTKPFPRSASPQQVLSAPPQGSQGPHRSPKLRPSDTKRHSKQHSSGSPAKSPVSARSRPQSMFLFPVSKSSSDTTFPILGATGGIASAGLAPPDEPKPRTSRRTSISDMVQMYESIGGRANVSGFSPVLPKPAEARATHSKEDSSFSRPQPGTASLLSKGDEDTVLRTDPPNNLEASKIRTSPTHFHNKSSFRTIPAGPRDVGRPKELDKAPNLRPTDSLSTADKFSSEPFNTKVAPRKSIAPPETPKAAEERSPSPDHSYQGVGKLIAQWQRKTEEATSSTKTPLSPRRGGQVGKRTALVGGTDKGTMNI